MLHDRAFADMQAAVFLLRRISLGTKSIAKAVELHVTNVGVDNLSEVAKGEDPFAFMSKLDAFIAEYRAVFDNPKIADKELTSAFRTVRRRRLCARSRRPTHMPDFAGRLTLYQSESAHPCCKSGGACSAFC
jgi:hypothetical protein